MPDIVIRPRARRDLEEIWRYTFAKWGEAQADLYLGQLDAGIRSLARFPDLGEPVDEVRAAYRKLQVNRHLVFYRLHGERIEIVRVLHQSMDLGRQLT